MLRPPSALRPGRLSPLVPIVLLILGCVADTPGQGIVPPDNAGIIRIREGGTPDAPRIVDGGGQQVRGIDLRGGGRDSPPASNVIVRNYVVRSDSDDRTGVWIAGRRQENIVIENINVQGFQIGIQSMGATNLIVRNCDVSKCQMGLSINAYGALIENCNVHELVYRGMGDSDYIRFAGEDITFRGNRLWGADVAALSRRGSHVDGWQVFTQDGTPRRNIIFEDNIVMDFHQAIIAQDRNPAPSELVGNWIIRNNIFAHGHSWSLLFENTNGVAIENNLFYDINPKGMGVRFGSRITSLKNNIMVNMKSGVWVDKRSTLRNATGNIYRNVSRERPGSALGIGDPQIIESPRGTFRLAPGSPLHGTSYGPAMLRGDASGPGSGPESASAPPSAPVEMTVVRSARRPLEIGDDPNRASDETAARGTERTGEQHARTTGGETSRRRAKPLGRREKAMNDIRQAKESLRALIEQAEEARGAAGPDAPDPLGTSDASDTLLGAIIEEAEKALESLERAEEAIGGRH